MSDKSSSDLYTPKTFCKKLSFTDLYKSFGENDLSSRTVFLDHKIAPEAPHINIQRKNHNHLHAVYCIQCGFQTSIMYRTIHCYCYFCKETYDIKY